jgi:hypothetical protein
MAKSPIYKNYIVKLYIKTVAYEYDLSPWELISSPTSSSIGLTRNPMLIFSALAST